MSEEMPKYPKTDTLPIGTEAAGTKQISHNESINVENCVEVLEGDLARLLEWIKSIDSKTQFTLTLGIAMLGASAGVSGSSQVDQCSIWIILVLGALGPIITLVFSALSTFPQTTGPEGSLIFFGGVCAMKLEDYKQAVKVRRPEEYLEDLISQCHRNAEIANSKFKNIKIAMIALIAGAIPWAFSIYILLGKSNGN